MARRPVQSGGQTAVGPAHGWVGSKLSALIKPSGDLIWGVLRIPSEYEVLHREIRKLRISLAHGKTRYCLSNVIAIGKIFALDG